MIFIKNVKIFTCDISESFHWSKLPKLKEKMETEKFVFDSDADLSYANLSDADLRGAKLQPIDDKEVIIQDFMSVCGLGSQNRQTLIFNTNIGIVLQCGCFYGTEAQFKEKVQEKHAGTNYEQEYLKMLELAHIRFSRKQKD